MKKILTFYLICLMGVIVSANGGYYPVTLLSNQGYNSISYCSFDKPCFYLGNETLNSIALEKQEIKHNKNNALFLSLFSIVGLMITISFILIISVKMIYRIR